MFGRSNTGGRGQHTSNFTGHSAGVGTASVMAAIIPNAPIKNYQTTGPDAGPSGALVEGEWSSLNPNLYQNMSNDQVDWAALAQQWIQMKETLPANMVPAAPPPPIISDNYVSNSRESIPDGARSGSTEQGEAPMEVEREEDHNTISSQHQQANVWDNGAAPWHYNTSTEWRNPAWETNWTTETSTMNDAPVKSSYESVTVNPNASIAVANWQAKMARIYKIGETSHPSEIAGAVQPVVQHSLEHPSASKRIPGLMDQVIKLDQDHVNNIDQEEDTTQTINDAKRKLLPAWIREGLEKMEREKLRQEEKEKEMRLREEMLEQRRKAELEALTELENARKKSKFESDSEEEEEDDVESGENITDARNQESSPLPYRSRDEILQELMVAVRRNLTEILLEVTNEEIALVAKDTLSKMRRKAPTAQALRKTGIATLTGGLGLGIYGDSDEEDESDPDKDSDNDADSDTDDEEVERSLRNTIKLRQKEFEWTAREIEDQLAQEEAREERKRREYEQVVKDNQDRPQRENESDDEDYTAGSNRVGLGHSQSMAAHSSATGNVHGGKFGSRDGETQPVNDKLYAYKLGRQRDKRISRFSDPKDTVRQTHITHVAIVNHKPGEIVQPLSVPKVSQSAAISGPSSVATSPVNSAPLFPAAISATMHLEQYQRGNSITSETPSNASSSRASSSHRTVRDESSRKSSHKSHKSKKHKRSRHSRSDDEEDYYDDDHDDRYSQHSRRSHSSERSTYSRRRRSYSRDSRDDDRDRKYSYRSKDRSRSRSRDRYRSSRRTRSRSRSSSKRRY
ncbi:arginine/serine-rich protein PNISR-like [Malaya genurostris]|uniref:arginine/serine-rich protein PNISR-like n=1 Tax=Malaya genurostris TaxID=325434 RepID=UPI0026F3B4C4|nr:arginine/serine-rich protein PNISR-like [Malaya genurostris]